MSISSNAYYNYRKNRKESYRNQVRRIHTEIKRIYHEYKGVPGHRTIMYLLKNKGITISKTTTHNYMNLHLGLRSVVRRKKPGYVKGKAHKIFENKLDRQFKLLTFIKILFMRFLIVVCYTSYNSASTL